MKRILEKKKVLIFIILILLIVISYMKLQIFLRHQTSKKNFSINYYDIETLKSNVDYDKDGIDDFSDLMLGARAYIETTPIYKSEYYNGGYPPDGIGVCTDVIWNAFKSAGYSLKDLVDKDISNNLKSYPTIDIPDSNIDFRRVKNLKIFFDRNAKSLTLDPKRIHQWQPGDIVIYPKHIAIVSDKRNGKGIPYIIHNAGQPILEEDALTKRKIIGHYRWTH